MQEILTLLATQMNLLNELGRLRTLQARQYAGQEISSHRRDDHQSYWDSDSAIRDKNELDERVRVANAKFEKNQGELSRLTEKFGRVAA